MKRGPKPTPIATLKLRGAYREDRHGSDVDIVAGQANAPDDLPEDAREMWQRLAPDLAANGLLKSADALAFEVLCREAARWNRLEQQVVETGGPIIMVGGVPKTNPALREAQKARDAFMIIVREFGMTPSARRNVNIEPSAERDDIEGVLRSIRQ